jgi:hypothetical protein
MTIISVCSGARMKRIIDGSINITHVISWTEIQWIITTKSTALGRHLSDFVFKAQDQQEKATNNFANERKDCVYEQEYLDDWEDFNCIDALLDSQAKLTQALEDLEEAQFQIGKLRDQVLQLKKSSI